MRRLFAAAVLASVALPAFAVNVSYTITVRPRADSVHVSEVVANDPDTTVTVAMPVWVPGYYRILNQNTGVSNVDFREGGQDLPPDRPTGSSWSVLHTPDAPLTVSYDVKALEFGFNSPAELTLGQMGIYVGRDDGFIHPGVACMYVDGHKDAASNLSLKLPRKWDSAMPLPQQPDGSYQAPDYDTLDDSPVQLGHFRRIPFTARNHNFEIIASGNEGVSDKTLLAVTQPIAAATIDVYGGWTPFDAYQFHFHFPPKRPFQGAGLEHRSSTVIVFSGGETDATFSKRAASYISHEFFHAWNVKSIKPFGLGPFDYQHAVPTPSLWQAEGFTNYYMYITPVRSGVWAVDQGLTALERLIEQYQASEGRNKTDLAASSMGVWATGSSNGSGGTSYYTKGSLAAFLLDIQIRAATANKRSLDDAMRWMAQNYAVPNKGYPPDAMLTAIKESTGVDLSTEYQAYIHGTTDLPFERVLPLAAIKMETIDTPGTAIGVSFDPADKDPIARAIAPNTPADGILKEGDLLLRVDDIPVAGPRRRGLLGVKSHAIGDKVNVLIKRDGEEKLVVVTVPAEKSLRLTHDASAQAASQAIWSGLWASQTPTPM